MKIEENKPLGPLTTLGVGGPASFYVEVKTSGEVVEACGYAKKQDIPLIALGDGSNVLISDNGFFGIVLHLLIKGIAKASEDNDFVTFRVGAGEEWDTFVRLAVENNLFGVENLSGIPGTVGAAPIQNIGAYGIELADVVTCVEAIDTKTCKHSRFSTSQCDFGYRTSLFKKTKRYIVTHLHVRLHKNVLYNLTYKDLEKHFANEKPQSSSDVRNAVLEIRSKKFPDMSACGCAGSFFKNPVITKEEYNHLLSKYPEMPSYSAEKNKVKVPLAWILDHVCNLKGFRKGSVGLHNAQPLVVVNYGDATADEIVTFVRQVARTVKEKTNIKIENEVQYIGF